MGTLQTADSVGAGKPRRSAQVLALRLTQGGGGRAARALGAGGRGARASTFGLERSGKVRRVDSGESPWVASLAPVVGVPHLTMRLDSGMTSSEQRHAALPRVVGGTRRGGSLGCAFRASPRVRLMPEVAVMMPLGSLPGTDRLRLASASAHVRFGLAFMLDSARDG